MLAQSAPSRAACRTTAAARLSRRPVVARAAVGTGRKLSIQVISSPSQSTLQELGVCSWPTWGCEELGVRSWPTWGCEVSKFPWSYDENETCYVLEGRVIVTPNGGEGVEIKAGDMATFPAGMSCTWDVKKAIKKHYNFH